MAFYRDVQPRLLTNELRFTPDYHGGNYGNIIKFPHWQDVGIFRDL